MRQPRRETEPSSARVSLHIGSSPASAWEDVLLPWFEGVALAALEDDRPIAVVTPFPSAAVFLRSKLLEHGTPLLGVRFMTPALLREFLLADGAQTLPLREHLRLLVAIAAESASGSKDVELAAIAKSIARAPDNLLRTFDQLSAAGWSFEDVGPPALREIIKTFLGLVRKCGFQFVHEADRAAVKSARNTPPRFRDLLLIGFTAEHWPLWPLSQAAVLSAKRATVVLECPREQTRAADESWIGTWEENFEPAMPIGGGTERSRPFAELIRSTDPAVHSKIDKPLHFLVGRNATEQARAIAAIALKFLEEKSCTRLGILFPRTGALPRLVSELLTRAGVPHNDGIGHLAPSRFENPAWDAWLDLQENHQLAPVLRFLEAHPESLNGLSIAHVRDKLRRAYRDILIDDANVLAEYCARIEELVPIAKLLRANKLLPSKATLRAFLTETKAIFAKLDWNDRWSEIEQRARHWSDALLAEFSRASYLRWLKEIINSFEVERAPEANHLYSRVHLLSYAEAEAQEWSHLILVGLNQGEWPPGENESGFLRDEVIVNLNTRATRSGKQGEGHSVLREDKTFLLGPQDQRQIAVRHFAAALESVEHGLAMTATLLKDDAPERFWNPSELFSQAYFSTYKSPLSQETMSMLREKTCAWLKTQELFERSASEETDIAQTRTAYEVRRRADTPFGEYEFALREPLEREITLRVTDWEKALKTPALIWLKACLGLENEEPDLNQWNAATGIWVHDWLAHISGGAKENVFVDLPPNQIMCERVAQAARQFQRSIVDLCAACGRTVPDWWMSGWSNALALADYLASKLIDLEEWPQVATEWHLKSPLTVSINGGSKLRLRGRIDLILARAQPDDSQFSNANIWIADYKTNNTKTLTVSGKTPEIRFEKMRKKLVRGDAIQLGLYGMAARELGAGEINLSILSLRTELDRPQLKIGDLAQHLDFWGELYRMQENGIFGLRGHIRNEFGFNPDYPLATLPIDKEFLDEKWVLTHPAFADDEDDRS